MAEDHVRHAGHDGEIGVARLLTVTRTCQLQQLNPLAYLTAASRAPWSSSGCRITAVEAMNPLNCYEKYSQ